jgi:hypothetical protein
MNIVGLENLTTGAKIYINFQLVCLALGLFCTYVQVQILKNLKNK